MKFQLLLIISLFGILSFANAQEAAKKTDTKALDEFNYEKIGIKERKVIPYPILRDADVVYSKIVYRDIDVREKKNLCLKWERNPFYKILRDAVAKGEPNSPGKIACFDKSDSEMRGKALTTKEVVEIGGRKETIDSFAPDDEENERAISVDKYIPYDWSTIKKYRLKEEWIFDKQRSEFFVRIVAIAPFEEKDIAGEKIPVPMFWIDYKSLRSALVNQEIFNTKNDAMRLSYLDFFEYRLFGSYITGENNVLDYNEISLNPEFKDNPMSALYEAERIKNDLFTWEHDLWEY